MEKKSISRRDFLKGVAAGSASAAVMGIFPGSAMKIFAGEEGVYTPGTYTSVAKGIQSDVTVTMTFDANNITDIQIDVSGETPEIGGAIGETMKAAILESQSSEVDGIASATISSDAVKLAAANCIAQAKGEPVTAELTQESETAVSWKTAPDPIPDDQISETIETDVVILGLGHAGLAVYRELAEQGVNAIAVEVQEKDTWWTFGHDLGHLNSNFLREKGLPDIDIVEFVNNWQMQTHNKSNVALVMKFAKNCGEAVDWYLEAVDQDILDMARIPYWPETERTIKVLNNGLRYYPGEIQWWEDNWNGQGMVNNTSGIEMKDLSRNNYDYVEANYDNVQALFGTRAVQLVKEGDTVTGLIAQKADGSYVKLLAAKGVVLAGGGFGGNAEMCKDLLPHIDRTFTPEEDFTGAFDRDGSSIQMGVWAGGRLETDISTMNFDSMAIPDYIPGPLWVNDKGMRFQNEGFAGPEINGFYAARNMRGKIISVYDSNYKEQILTGFPGHQSFDYSNEETVAAMVANFEAAKEAGAEGANDFYCADTLEELAARIGFGEEEKAEFLKTVEAYNTVCEAGIDTDFGKDPHFLKAIVEGPFYAHVTAPSLGFALVTTGGFVTTNDQQVLDEEYQPIPGLYATGNTCGMRFGPAYITPIPGVSIGMCITLGRELGRYLAEL